MFAEEGLSAVALRRVVKAAGASNASALHYHFGGRDGLVAGIVDTLRAWLQPRWSQGLTALELMDDASPRAVLHALYDPVLGLQQAEGYGTAAIRFAARLSWDFVPSGQDLSAALHREPLGRASALLAPTLSGLPVETRQLRLLMTMTNVYHGLADRSYLWRSPFGASPLAESHQADRLQEQFFDYLESGLIGPKISTR